MMRWVIIAWLALAGAARAQASGTAPDQAHEQAHEQARQQAREAFARAIALSDQQRPKEALVELERAYQLSPHYAVLYNLGKTYAALDMPLEAIDALERYLSEGGDRIELARRAQVEALVGHERTRVASLALDVAPAGAAIAIDARAIGKAPLAAPVLLIDGEHTVHVALEGYAPFSERVAVSAGQRSVLHVRLATEARGTLAELGLLALRCDLPDVRIALGERTLETTPLRAPLALPAGAHTLALSRKGYRTQQLAVDVRGSALTQATCALAPVDPLPADAGQLAIAVSEPGATIAIDGAPAAPSARLPAGRHRIEVRRTGFMPHVEDITLGAGEALGLRAELRPEPAYRLDYEARAHAQRTWAFVLGGAGIALTGAAATILIWNESRYADWRNEDEALTRALESGAGDPDDLERRQALNNDALTSIQRWEVAAVGTGVAGLLLGAAGAVLFFTGDDPDRYAALELKAAPGAVALFARGAL
jgi:hypothetical protein